MHLTSRIITLSLLMLVFSSGCEKESKDSTPAAAPTNATSCSVVKDAGLTLCTEYQGLTGTTLTAVQSDCQLKSDTGYTWAASGCQATGRAGSCSIPSTPQKPVPGTQYFYGAIFVSSPATAQGMCSAMGGSYTP